MFTTKTSFFDVTEHVDISPSYMKACLGHSMMVNDHFTTTIKSDVRASYSGDVVDVYRNLNIKGMMSCKQRKGTNRGKVSGYARAFVLTDFSFVVSESSRQRVLSEKRKNVHSFCRGTLTNAFNCDFDENELSVISQVVTYNPYKAGYFFDRATGKPVFDSPCTYALIYGANVYLIN